MKKRSLLTTNRFIKIISKRNRLLLNTVLTSSAVEGIHIPANKILESEGTAKTILKQAGIEM